MRRARPCYALQPSASATSARFAESGALPSAAVWPAPFPLLVEPGPKLPYSKSEQSIQAAQAQGSSESTGHTEVSIKDRWLRKPFKPVDVTPSFGKPRLWHLQQPPEICHYLQAVSHLFEALQSGSLAPH